MNSIIRYIVIILLFFPAILSCKKSSEGSDTNADNLRISRIIQNPAASPGKVMTVIDFNYDDQDRVVQIDYFKSDSVNGALLNNKTDVIKFYYNGTERNPYRSTGKSPNNSMFVVDADAYFSYNASGKLIRDSIHKAGTSYYSVRDYTWSNDRIIVKKTGSSSPGVYYDSFTVKNNNITGAYYFVEPPPEIVSGAACSYDDKINPISKLNIAAMKVAEGVTGFPDYLAPGVCQNNITEYYSGYINEQGVFTKNLVQTFLYTYTKEGLPEKCITTYVTNTYTINYFYKKL